MAELTLLESASDPCCAPEQQASCCEPDAKASCCSRTEGCSCDAGGASVPKTGVSDSGGVSDQAERDASSA